MFQSKINAEQAEAIRAKKAKGATIQALAQEYQVDRSTISRVLQEKKKTRRQKQGQTSVYTAFIEEILVQMRTDTFTALDRACDHVADEAMRKKINEWSYTHARPLILEASEGLRGLLLDEMERLFAEGISVEEAR